VVSAFGLTDVGCVRKVNQDSLLLAPELGLYLVADGMGGARGGEWASRIAVETVHQVVSDATVRDESILATAYDRANFRVWERASQDSSLEGMGTTLVGVLSLDEGIAVANVGDSRAYLFHEGELSQLTEDQTWVNEVGRRLGVSEEKLKVHPMRHVLTMAIGVSNPLTVKTFRLKPEPADQILLCSDGLHGPVSPDQIQAILIAPMPLEERCRHLIDAAKKAGGPDNVTALLLEF
jgi:PPM family protein phosphatase